MTMIELVVTDDIDHRAVGQEVFRPFNAVNTGVYVTGKNHNILTNAGVQFLRGTPELQM